jgi:hypothetical protein
VADVPAHKISEVLVIISERLITESSPEQAATIWAATKILLGLRYSIEQVVELVRGVSAMILAAPARHRLLLTVFRLRTGFCGNDGDW